TTKAAEKSTVKITIKFDGEEWKKAQNDAYLKTRHKYRVDGFRNGKAPKNRIESFYGKSVFWDDALNLLIQENYDKILEKESKKYVFVGEPEFQLEDLKDDLVVIVATVPVKPEVKISAYTGMKIEKFAYTVSDADVQAEIDRLLDKKATREEVTDRAAENGDIVTIDFVGTVDGVKFDGGEAEGYDLVLGSGSFIPGFEDQVVGMNLGEKKDVNVTFPEDYQSAELKGKAAVFAVTLHKIQKKVLPELTDEFVKENAGEETVAAYKEKTAARLQENLDRRANDATENSILEAIAANTEVEIPQAMIEREIDSLVKRFEYQLMYQGLKLADYLSFLKVSEADFRQNYVAQAEKNVKSQLIISHIIDVEKIEATEEELEAKIAAQAASVDKDPAEYKATMDPRQIDYLRNDIIITKLFDFLKANNEMFVAA
ncbi:MAG: trigger factor, partial [Clostridia bacterium]|nr:trigger factor [Clostridia bacterium]